MESRLRELGVCPGSVLREAGLSLRLFEEPRILLDTQQFFSLHRAIGWLSSQPAIGLELGREPRLARHNPVALAALASSNFREALQRIARYKRLNCPEEIQLHEADGESRVEFVFLLAQHEEPEVLIDTCFAWIHSVLCRGTGREIPPLNIELRRRTADEVPYRKFFDCPVRLGQARNRIVYRPEDLNAPFLTHNPELLEIVAPALEAELRNLSETRLLKDQVRAYVLRSLAGARPRLEQIAAGLGLTPRTLQRRLLEEGESLHQVVESARREMARQYLLESSLDLSDTAYLLGYADTNSFIRAFHRWEGESPGQWRARRAPAARVS